MGDSAQLTIGRIGIGDSLRLYEVKLDGTIVGRLRAFESLTIPLAQGEHSIEVRIDWCGSQPTNFEVQPGEHVRFQCGNNLIGWRAIFWSLYLHWRPNHYLWLRRTAESSACEVPPNKSFERTREG